MGSLEIVIQINKSVLKKKTEFKLLFSIMYLKLLTSNNTVTVLYRFTDTQKTAAKSETKETVK